MRKAGLTAMTCALLLAMAGGRALAQQGLGEPVLKEGSAKKISPHVFEIVGFPNIFFVIGSKATLVVDTGLGARNGAILAREAARLSPKGAKFYLTTTHYHPEHASGQGGFPAGYTVIRNRAQQAELEADGPRMNVRFSGFTPEIKDLLQGAVIGKADVLYDSDYTLDLGGVKAKMMFFGTAHTLGDELIMIPEDSALISGDVVQNHLSPNVICDRCSPRQWLLVLDKIAPLKPRLVFPDHGDIGDGALITQEQGFLRDLQTQAMALKAQGVSVEDASKRISEAFAVKYSGWSGLGNVPQSVQRAYADPVG